MLRRKRSGRGFVLYGLTALLVLSRVTFVTGQERTVRVRVTVRSADAIHICPGFLGNFLHALQEAGGVTDIRTSLDGAEDLAAAAEQLRAEKGDVLVEYTARVDSAAADPERIKAMAQESGVTMLNKPELLQKRFTDVMLKERHGPAHPGMQH